MTQQPTDRLLFAGDWHMNLRWAVGAVEYAAQAGADRIVHVGDFGFTFADEFVYGLSRSCVQNAVTLYFVDGNHDNHGLLADLPIRDDGFAELAPGILFAPRGHRWEWWGVTFLALGGAVSVDRDWRTPLVDWWPTEKITHAQALRVAEGGHADVMVTHDCPAGIEIPGLEAMGARFGFPENLLRESGKHRELLADVVAEVRPSLLVHGHYHIRYEAEQDGMRVVGLSQDGSGLGNLWLVDAADLPRADVATPRV